VLSPRDADQHGRHPEGERDLARRLVFRLKNIHDRWNEAHRLPAELAFEHQRYAHLMLALIAALQLTIQPADLVRRQVAALLRRIDERLRGPRSIVDRRLVPAAL
jgi:hypothetical protein